MNDPFLCIGQSDALLAWHQYMACALGLPQIRSCRHADNCDLQRWKGYVIVVASLQCMCKQHELMCCQDVSSVLNDWSMNLKCCSDIATVQ